MNHRSPASDDRHVRRIYMAAAGVIMSLGLMHAMLVGVISLAGWELIIRPAALRQRAPADLEHWSDPGAYFQRVHEPMTRRLAALEWVDSQRKIARIPIEEAMRIIARRMEEAAAHD